MIREIREEDLPQLVDIWNAHFEKLTSSKMRHDLESVKEWFEAREEKGFKYLGYFEGENLTGFTIVKDMSDVIWIKFISIKKGEERRGIGSKLVDGIVERYGGKEIKTEVLSGNPAALEFFKKQGFRVERHDQEEKQFILKRGN